MTRLCAERWYYCHSRRGGEAIARPATPAERLKEARSLKKRSVEVGCVDQTNESMTDWVTDWTFFKKNTPHLKTIDYAYSVIQTSSDVALQRSLSDIRIPFTYMSSTCIRSDQCTRMFTHPCFFWIVLESWNFDNRAGSIFFFFFWKLNEWIKVYCPSGSRKKLRNNRSVILCVNHARIYRFLKFSYF